MAPLFFVSKRAVAFLLLASQLPTGSAFAPSTRFHRQVDPQALTLAMEALQAELEAAKQGRFGVSKVESRIGNATPEEIAQAEANLQGELAAARHIELAAARQAAGIVGSSPTPSTTMEARTLQAELETAQQAAEIEESFPTATMEAPALEAAEQGFDESFPGAVEIANATPEDQIAQAEAKLEAELAAAKQLAELEEYEGAAREMAEAGDVYPRELYLLNPDEQGPYYSPSFPAPGPFSSQPQTAVPQYAGEEAEVAPHYAATYSQPFY